MSVSLDSRRSRRRRHAVAVARRGPSPSREGRGLHMSSFSVPGALPTRSSCDALSSPLLAAWSSPKVLEESYK
eukprot:6460983-Pyramimonas_sp.AAC.1